MKKNKSTALSISSMGLCLSLLFSIGLYEWEISDNGSSLNLELGSRSFDDLQEIPQTEQA